MIINEKDVAVFDVDSTLIKWVDAPRAGITKALDFYGITKHVQEIKVHTEFLKSLKARGYFIRVHSGNGYLWASQVVEALGLQGYVDMVETKVAKVIDDKPNSDWMPNPIYLGDE